MDGRIGKHCAHPRASHDATQNGFDFAGEPALFTPQARQQGRGVAPHSTAFIQHGVDGLHQSVEAGQISGHLRRGRRLLRAFRKPPGQPPTSEAHAAQGHAALFVVGPLGPPAGLDRHGVGHARETGSPATCFQTPQFAHPGQGSTRLGFGSGAQIPQCAPPKGTVGKVLQQGQDDLELQDVGGVLGASRIEGALIFGAVAEHGGP